jgi:hypothetical protein
MDEPHMGNATEIEVTMLGNIVKQSASRKVSLGCLSEVNLDILVEEIEITKEKGKGTQID